MDVKREMKLKSWAADIEDQKRSGLSRAQWCKIHGIPSSTFDYRYSTICKYIQEQANPAPPITLPAIKETTDPTPVFAQVNLTKTEETKASISISFGDTKIDIARDADSEHIKIVLEALRYA